LRQSAFGYRIMLIKMCSVDQTISTSLGLYAVNKVANSPQSSKGGTQIPG